MTLGRGRVGVAVKVAFTLLLLGWLLSRTNLGEIGAAMRGAVPAWIAAAIATQVIGILLSVWRWRLLLRIQGACAPASFLTRSYLVGIFFSNFLPSTVGGDIVRARDTAPFLGSGTRAATVIVVERVSGIFALGLFALGAPLFGLVGAGRDGSPQVWVIVGALALVFAAALALLREPVLERGIRWCARRAAGGGVPKLFERLGHLLETLAVFTRNPAAFRTTFLIGLLLQADVILHFACISQSLRFPVPVLAFLIIVPVMAVVMLLPVSINGIGAREAVFVFFLGRYGVTTPEAIAFSWISYGIVLVTGLLGGAVYALRGPAAGEPGPGTGRDA
jgi:uncharacterized protein (TIRG00374 family)